MVSRKVDDLGRVVLPIDIRKNLDIKNNDIVDISVLEKVKFPKLQIIYIMYLKKL